MLALMNTMYGYAWVGETERLHSIILCVGRRIYCLRPVLLHLSLGWGQSFIITVCGKGRIRACTN